MAKSVTPCPWPFILPTTLQWKWPLSAFRLCQAPLLPEMSALSSLPWPALPLHHVLSPASLLTVPTLPQLSLLPDLSALSLTAQPEMGAPSLRGFAWSLVHICSVSRPSCSHALGATWHAPAVHCAGYGWARSRSAWSVKWLGYNWFNEWKKLSKTNVLVGDSSHSASHLGSF